jgi:hypothetical protein
MKKLKHMGHAAGGLLPMAALLKLGLPMLEALVLLIVLTIGVICWVLNDDKRTSRLVQILAARQYGTKDLATEPSMPLLPSPKSRRKRAVRHR